MDIALGISIAGIFIALIVGCSQISLAKKMKDFEIRQDERDEQRRRNDIYAEATKFIQKYNKNSHNSDILLLPLCVSAYKYNPIFPYRREIYRDFCSLTEEIQNEILRRQEIDLKSFKCQDYYSNIVSKILSNNKACYPNDNDNQLFYESTKYFHKAIISHGNKAVPNALSYDIITGKIESNESPVNANQVTDFEEYLTDLLAYHKNETPLSDLVPCFQSCDEIIASYICCLIAKNTAIFNQNESDMVDDKICACDYTGPLFMEDLFLDTLYTVENYIISKKN